MDEQPRASETPLPSGTPPTWERATLERLMFASVAEQRSARRWKTFRSLAWLVFWVLLLWVLLHRGTPSTD